MRTKKLPIIMLVTLLFGCSTQTRFKDLDKRNEFSQENIEDARLRREIASESPMSLGCHTLIEDIIYLKEQREFKEAQKRKKALEALK